MHLHVHSSYSLLEGALTIARLAELAKKDRQPALALTNTDNMFGALEFSEKMAGAGIQPIVGCALGVDFGDRDDRPVAMGQGFARIVLLAAREHGYRSLMRLLLARLPRYRAGRSSRTFKFSWLAGRCQRPDRAQRRDRTVRSTRLSPPDRAHLRSRAARDCSACSVIASTSSCNATACRPGATGRAGAHRSGLLARRGPLVATNEPFFATREDYEAHDALLCIAEGRMIADGDRRQLRPSTASRRAPKWRALFADLPEALAATVEVAERCAFRPRTLAPILPRFSTGPSEGKTVVRRPTRRRSWGRGGRALD